MNKRSQLFSTLATIVVGLGFISSAHAASARLCPQPWVGSKSADCELRPHSLPIWNNWSPSDQTERIVSNIRSGFLKESATTPFRGNVIYYQGLGDSMLNHMPLFSKLTNAGFRVIAFDYMGQGGSEGDMNNTRILQIPYLGNQVWKMYARDLTHFPKKTIIGWSTGGLAAYAQAAIGHTTDNIVLIAPGIVPNMFVGEQHPFSLKLNLITMKTLTTAHYTAGVPNPHIDPIRPTSPLEVFDGFGWDILNAAKYIQILTMNPKVKGLVLLSGPNDTYVDAEATLKVLKKQVPQFARGGDFEAKVYPSALHEIDNETEEVSSAARQDILDFVVKNSR